MRQESKEKLRDNTKPREIVRRSKHKKKIKIQFLDNCKMKPRLGVKKKTLSGERRSIIRFAHAQ